MHNLRVIYIFWIIVLFGQVGYCQINANFTVNDSVGCNSLIVQFTNTTEGLDTLLFQWDFGNGNTSTLANPVAVFNTVGKYTVSLKAYTNNNADTLVKPEFIIVNKSPVIKSIHANNDIGCVPHTTTYEAIIDTGSAPINLYIWDLGDGNSSSLQQPVNTYQNSGDFNVTLFVSDSNSCESTYSAIGLIKVIANPVVGFSSSKNVACFDTLTILFNNVSYGESPLTYLWDFGNGVTSTEDSPVNYYSGFNDYTVSLTATDTFSCTSSVSKTNYVKMQELTVNADILDDYLCKKETLQILNETKGANKYYWDFGDGTTSSRMVPVKSYQDTGMFNITFIAFLDNSCSDTVYKEVYVDPVTAKFSTDRNYGCEFPFAVQYSNNSVGAVKSQWLFGDLQQSNIESPEIVYDISPVLKEMRNIYLIDTLIVESEMQCTDILVDSSIHLYLPKVYYTPNDSNAYNSVFKGCVPIEINFQNRSESYFEEDPFVKAEWDFGDSNSSSENDPTHEYLYAGDFMVKLSLTNQSGCVNSFTSTLLAGTPQQAEFSYSGDPIICGSELVQLNNVSTVDSLVDAWNWEFSDSTNVDSKSPEIQFIDTGFISGELTVFYNGCIGSTFLLDSFVYVNGPAGDVSLSLNCEEPLKYYFGFNIKGADAWKYDFGDGINDSLLIKEVSHEYATSGDFNSFIEAYTSNSNCSLRIDKKINVRQLEANFVNSPVDICPGTEVTFNPEQTVDNGFFVYENNLVKYLWDFGDSSEMDFAFGISDHIYSEPGSYVASLLVKDVNGCSQNLEKSIKVLNVKAEFTYDDSIGCAPMDVLFYDASNSDTTIVDWFWDFGDGQKSTDQNPAITFTNDKNLTVSLIVSDAVGCADTLIKEKAIYSSKPSANFKALITKTCFSDSVQFINLSEGGKLENFKWTFGNGMTSTELNPKIVFPDTGYFDVSLWIMDSIGCDSQITKPNYLYVQANPIADFTMDAFSSACYPKVIGFNDLSVSTDIKNRYWTFGDDEVSIDNKDPYHTYQKPGIFDVSLKVTTSFGCFDTITKNDIIDIGGPYAEIFISDTACINTPISISFKDSINIYSFQWTLEDGSSYATNPFSNSYNSFGAKKVYLSLESDSIGTCSKLLVDSLQIPILTADFALNDPALCTPYSTLALNSSINANTFKWYIDNSLVSTETEPEISIQEPGLHNIKLLAESIIACRDSVSKQATVFALPNINLSNDTLICQYDSVLLQANDGINYFWYAENQLIDSAVSNIWVSPLTSLNYKVKVTNINACINMDSTLVTVQPKPIISVLTPDTLIIIGEQIELQATHQNADEISWYPINEVSCLDCENTLVQPLQSIMFYFSGTDNAGCFAVSDSVFVTVDAKYSVDLPTSFSPNGDGINDFLFVMGWGIKELVKFTIYDLNGRMLFQTNNISEGWDGNSTLGLQPEGMYLYEVNILSYDNINRRKQGFFYIIK